MKSKTTILRQLLLNILIPVLVVFVIIFALTYNYNTTRLDETMHQQRKNIIAETRNLLSYFDYSMRRHEQLFISKMRFVSNELVTNYFKGNHNLDTVDLFRISRELKLDTSLQHIYLINRKLTITNTTFLTDLGINFAAINPEFHKFFGATFKEGKFKEDRFGEEMKTGKIKKYSFQPTLDKRYIVELGFYSAQADEYKAMLLEKIQQMSQRFPGISRVQLFLGVKDVRDPDVPKGLDKEYLNCLATKKNQQIPYDDPKTTEQETIDFIFLDARNTTLYQGYILEIDSSDIQARTLFRELILYFGITFLVTGIVITLIVYARARSITRPIQELSARTQAIDTSQLDQHITIGGSVELENLSSNFNSMMDKLRISYEGLEDKVRERTAELHLQKELVEHKNEEIIDSINYALFIQQAILPPRNLIQSHFPDSFVYYQPKDIIAGDFYWFEQRGNVSWFAASDCTGHGVPGAMVSVLCINALNQLLLEKNCTEPGELLNHVREHIVKTFTKEGQAVKDGMDCSIACYNHDTQELCWTGANNPLWLIRDGECIIYAADKQPVGKFDGEFPFTTNRIPLQKGDLIILFTDGFPDQFGGPKQKKFKYAPLRELIIEHATLPMDELHDLLKTTFNDWKGETEQTDDVCIMGMRIG